MATSVTRVVSLLPAITDLICELGGGHKIIAHSHECDGVQGSVITKAKLDVTSLSGREIAAGWGMNRTRQNELQWLTCDYYHVDIDALSAIRPQIILTILPTPKNSLDPTHEEIVCALKHRIPTLCDVLHIDPITATEIYAAAFSVSDVLLLPRTIVQQKIAMCKNSIQLAHRGYCTATQRIAIVQWADPIWLAGAWVPEAVAYAGGDCAITRPGGPSVVCNAQSLTNCDIIVFAICAVDLTECGNIARRFLNAHHKLFRETTRFIATDANTLFSRATLTSLSQTVQVLSDITTSSLKSSFKSVLWTELTPLKQSQPNQDRVTIACKN